MSTDVAFAGLQPENFDAATYKAEKFYEKSVVHEG